MSNQTALIADACRIEALNQKCIKEEPVIKILISGETGVGKTTYINRICTGNFSSVPDGLDVHTIYEYIEEGKPIYEIYENCNVENVDYVVVMTDLTDPDCLAKSVKWIQRAKDANIPVVLVMSKFDTTHQVNLSDIKKFTKKMKVGWFHLSSKTCYNFEKLFMKYI